MQRLFKAVLSVGIVLIAANCAVAQAQSGPPTDTPDTWQSKYIPKKGTAADYANVGDHVDLFSGALAIDQTDVAIPGTGPKIRIGRSFSGGTGRYHADSLIGEFADWSLNIPRLVGTINQGTSSTPWPTSRCSGSGQLDYGYTGFDFEYDGVTRHVVDAGSSVLPAGTVGVTKDFWLVSCLSGIQNGTGEGFLVTAPDGTKITLAHLKYQGTSPFDPCGVGSGTPVSPARLRAMMLATQVQDRFGNTISYNYNSNGDLASITASDGRSVSFGYTTYSDTNTNYDVITSMTANGRTWNYGYQQVTFTEWGYSTQFIYLQNVKRPDGTSWTFNLGQTDDQFAVYTQGWRSSGDQPVSTTGSITSPAGAVVTFTTNTGPYPGNFSGSPSNFALGATPELYATSCSGDQKGTRIYWLYENASVQALQQKQVTGPGLSTLTWTYNRPAVQGWPSTGSGTPTKTVSATSPEGIVDQYTFSILWDWTEGQMLEHDVYPNSSATAPSRKVTYQYQQGAVVGSTTVPGINGASVSRASLPASVVIAQDGDTYTTAYTSYDAYNNPLGSTESNSFGLSRIRQQGYLNNTSLWVLGQPTTTSIAGVTSVTNAYNSSAELSSVSDFGLLRESYTYNSDGDLATSKDGLNHTTQYQNWLRGVPQKIVRANNTSVSAVANGDGTVASSTDARGNTTSYSYDPLSRLAGVQWPSGDTVAWSPRSITYVISNDLGMPAGALRARVVDGAHQVSTYYDGLERPAVVQDLDTNSGISIYKTWTYDSVGRTVFQSYPSASPGSTAGIHTVYDALGRVTEKYTTDGVTLELDSYLSGNHRQLTDADNNITTTGYQAYGQPEQSKPIDIMAPLTQHTQISRDVFGTIFDVNQSGSSNGYSVSVLRSYLYDSYHRLCRSSDPETGITAFGYDAASNMTWKATGLTSSSSDCLGELSIPWGRIVKFGYDALNRRTSDTYPLGTEGVSYGYDADSHLTSLGTLSNSWSYSYDKRGLLEKQSLSAALKTFDIVDQYDPIGHVAARTYPSGQTYSYAPDARGRPTQIDIFAKNITYWPNGAVQEFTYGNGVDYGQTLDSRLRPYTVHIWGAQAGDLVDYQYGYDGENNLLSVTDHGSGSDSRSLQYDALNRLQYASGVWGGTTYSYDAINNLRSQTTAGSTLTSVWDSGTNRIDGLSGSLSRTFTYDVQGNMTGNGVNSFTFDVANRLVSAANVATYVYDGNDHRTVTRKTGDTTVTVYDKDGELVYSYDSASSTGTSYLSLNKQPIAQVTPASFTYLHSDFLGSPVAATNPSGLWQWYEHYQPYGKKINGVSEELGFTGHVFDAATGLTDMQARLYDPTIGRFLSTDPETFVDSNPYSFNRYAYANNNPERFKDPDGKSPLEIAFLVADSVQLAQAISSGSGVGLAVLNVAVDAVGVVSPVPGVSEVAHAVEGAAKVAEVGEKAADAGKVAQETVSTTRELRGGDFATSKADSIEKAGGVCEYCGKNAATQGDHAKTLNSYKQDVNEGKITKADAKQEANSSGNIVASCKQCNEVDKHTQDLGTGPGQYNPPNPSDRVKGMMGDN